PREAPFASSLIRLSCSVAPWPRQLKRYAPLLTMRLFLALILIGSGFSQVWAQVGNPLMQIEGTVMAYSPFSRLTILVGPPGPNPKRSFHEHILLRLE